MRTDCDGCRPRKQVLASLECGLLRSIPLWNHTSLRIGGAARLFAQPRNTDALVSTLQWANRNSQPSIILGAGTNVVFPDAGFDGLVIQTVRLHGHRIDGPRLWAAAGERLSDIAWTATRSGLSGLEWACGIPGTVGGSVVMNAGAHGAQVSDVLQSAEVLVGDAVETLPMTELQLGYRTSAFCTSQLKGIVVGASFVLQHHDSTACIGRARRMLAERLARIPIGASAGSIFRNPADGPTAGELLDRAGCKGMRIGRALVSLPHANIIVNEGTKNAEDVLSLIDAMKQRVLDVFGVRLSEEVVRFTRRLDDR